MPFEIRQVAFDHPDAVALVAEVQQLYVALYGSADGDPTEGDMFRPPAGAFFVGYADGVAVATGAWRAADAVALGAVRLAEIKRMYVVPSHQRRGLARRMLAHLEQDALAAGYDGVVLSTGPEQPAGIALYRSSGYVDIAPFGYYGDQSFVDVVTFLGKRLGAPQVPSPVPSPAGLG